jgi:nicotinamide mononucleotide transporter
MPAFLRTLFDANHVLLDIHGYGLSTLELLSTLLGLWSYIEIVRRRLRGLLLGFAASIFLAAMFYQLRLYADMGLMVYYAVISILTLVTWRNSAATGRGIQVTSLTRNMRLALLLGLPLFVGALACITSQLHLWLPGLFPEPTRFCYSDATTTVLGITASILLIRRKTECMGLWLAADLISTVIYSQSGVYFLAGVYAAYALIDGTGLILWLRRSRDGDEATSPFLPDTSTVSGNDLAEGV